jgi:predicted secreted Zn-dependent protease
VNIRSATFILLALLISGAARADEITLKSGKIIAGKITSETDQSYTVKFGANMFLSVSKDEVSSVSRERSAPTRQTLTLEQAMSTSTVVTSTRTAKPGHPAAPRPASAKPASKQAAKPVAKPAVAKPLAPKSPVAAAPPVARPAAPKKAPVKAAVKKPAVESEHEVVSTETLKIGVARIERTTRFKTYEVDGKDFDSASRAILDETDGKGFLDGHKRSPSKTEWDVSWSGVPAAGGKQWASVVIVATVTVTLPGWKNLAQAPAADAEKWGRFLKEITDHEGGHLVIMHDALMSFGESASNLTDPGEKELKGETEALFKAIQDQATKRRQGYERRGSRPVPIPVKKKS